MRILLALDGSDPSLLARDLVANTRWPPETAVHVVEAFTVPVDWTGGIGSGMDWVGEVEDAVADRTVERLEALSQPLDAAGLSVETEAIRGRAADVIVETAAQTGADLIVTGSRGLGRLRSMLLGSVAAEVAARAACPVLVARAPRVSSLLVATDGSASAGIISERLCAWGSFAGLPADVIAVAVPDAPAYELMVSLYTLGDERQARQHREIQERAGVDAEDLARRLGEIGIPSTPHVRAGDPAPEILAAAADRGADLIVTGSRGLGGIDRVLLGSVARNIVTHARCSVLVVRGPGSKRQPKEATR